jgi:hypothetical protein
MLTISAGLSELRALNPQGSPGDSRPGSRQRKLGNNDQAGFAMILFRAPAANVSHAVRSTSLGARLRMLIR